MLLAPLEDPTISVMTMLRVLHQNLVKVGFFVMSWQNTRTSEPGMAMTLGSVTDEAEFLPARGVAPTTDTPLEEWMKAKK